MASLLKLNSWSIIRRKRSEFIEKGGWGKMPGQEKADYAVCGGCVAGIEALVKE